MKINFSALLTLILLAAMEIALVLPLSGETMTLEDTSGSKLTAKLISCDGTNLKVIRVSDKKSFSIPLSRLVDSSKAAVKTWQANGGGLVEDLEITVVTGKTGKTTGWDDFDDKRVNLDPTITIANPDTKMPSRKARITTLFLGRPVGNSSAIHVFRKSTFDLPSLQPGASKDFHVEKISSPYDSTGYSKFGSRYAGYVVLIHDADGGTLYCSKSVPSALLNNEGLTYLKMENGRDYDKNFKVITRSSYIHQ